MEHDTIVQWDTDFEENPIIGFHKKITTNDIIGIIDYENERSCVELKRSIMNDIKEMSNKNL
ncbi:MAG: hypothetical protein BZ136_00280 [Methanosphaera sp. rholeuAM74]|nr:MAG: hypothetical protein BZ136_00280 [Methanosphaera sp. rholeuAM74]